MSNIDKRATELLIENGMLVADTLRHLADNEIDSDYFAICHTNENGTEIECELAITDYARQAAGTVDELVKALESAEKRIAEFPGQKRLIGWRMADYTDETADPALAKNWSTAVDVLPIFEGDVNTKLSAAILQGAAGNSPVIPDGWVIVPVEPTKEMIDAGWSYYMTTKATSSTGVYGAMLAAAPQQE